MLYMQWKTMTFSLARYVYDKDVAAVPEHTLQVFGLLESDTIRQAIVGFQRDNPNVKVEFNNSGKGAGEISSDDIRTLITELRIYQRFSISDVSRGTDQEEWLCG